MNQPDFFIIGERRCGSTALAYWLQQHPQMFVAPRMDTAPFVEQALVGAKDKKALQKERTAWHADDLDTHYGKLFKDIQAEHLLVGEKSADYLFWTPAHERIKVKFPNIKLLVILRDPIERAWSMYWNERGKGREKRNFGDAIRQEVEQIITNDYARMHLSYMTRGLYARSLERLLETFPRSQVLVLIMEKVLTNPLHYWTEINEFLGLKDVPMQRPFNQVNQNRQLLPKSFVAHSTFLTAIDKSQRKLVKRIANRISGGNLYYKHKLERWGSWPWRMDAASEPMPYSDKQWLRKQYAPDIQQLEYLLNTDLTCWSYYETEKNTD